MSGRLRSRLTAFDGTPLRRGIAAAVVVALMAAGTGVAYAAWTASVTATSTASAATLTVTTTNVDSLGAALGNEAIAASGSVSLTSTGSVTIANTTTTTSTTVPALTLTLSSAGGTLASAVSATVWYQANGVCTAATTIGSGSVTGAWTGPVVLTSTLAKGASATYCVRSTIANRQDAAVAAGTQGFTPRVSAALTVGNFTGTASAQSSTAQATRSLFPVATPISSSWYMVKRAGSSGTGLCMDVSGAGTTSGTAVITYTCKTSDFANQEWQFTQDGTTGYFDIKGHGAQSLRVDAQTGSVAVVTDGAAVTQLWQPQLMSAGVYQFVNKSTGLCLVSSATSGTTPMTVATCDGSASQRFTLTETAVAGTLQNVACQDYTNATNISLSWTGNGLGPYRTQVQRGGIWYTVNTGTSAWQTNAEIQGSSVPTGSNPGPLTGWPDDDYPMRIIDGSNNVVASGLGVEVYTTVIWWVIPVTYLRCG